MFQTLKGQIQILKVLRVGSLPTVSNPKRANSNGFILFVKSCNWSFQTLKGQIQIYVVSVPLEIDKSFKP